MEDMQKQFDKTDWNKGMKWKLTDSVVGEGIHEPAKKDSL
jgi:hypothetical protein